MKKKKKKMKKKKKKKRKTTTMTPRLQCNSNIGPSPTRLKENIQIWRDHVFLLYGEGDGAYASAEVVTLQLFGTGK